MFFKNSMANKKVGVKRMSSATAQNDRFEQVDPSGQAVFPFGEKLKMLRTSQGFKLAVVAKSVGSTTAHLSAIETGRIENPGYKLVYELAKFYGVTFESLIHDGDCLPKGSNLTEKAARRLTPSEDSMVATYANFVINQRG